MQNQAGSAGRKVLITTFIPAAIATNLVVGVAVQFVKLPVYLDSIGTVVLGFTVGPWIAAGAGALSMLLMGLLVNPTSAY